LKCFSKYFFSKFPNFFSPTTKCNLFFCSKKHFVSKKKENVFFQKKIKYLFIGVKQFVYRSKTICFCKNNCFCQKHISAKLSVFENETFQFSLKTALVSNPPPPHTVAIGNNVDQQNCFVRSKNIYNKYI
jgi:hypothetical protein